MRKLFLELILLLVLIGNSACQSLNTVNGEPIPPSIEPLPVKTEDETLVISAVGDIMIHDTQIRSGYRPSSGDYDFSSFFTHVKPLLLASDLTIGNLETTFAGKKAEYSGYPRFNAPEVLAHNLKEAGFDVLLTANNHCLDKGQPGLINTLNTLDTVGIMHTGTFRTQEERNSTLIVEKKGVRTAILAYTYGTNGISPAKDKPFSVNYLSTETIVADIKKARAEDSAQIVIVCLHFGIEYKPYPNAEQQQLVQLIFDEGADAVIGYHPHVLQPSYIFTSEDDKDSRKFAIYSLGNFISDQKGLERVSSIILNLHYGIDSTSGEPYFKKATYVPIRTRLYRKDGRVNFEVLPIEAALVSAKKGQTTLKIQEEKDLNNSFTYICNHLKSDDPMFQLQPLAIPLDALYLLKKWQ